ncbi:MAG TPA: hypothetical protein V6C76_11610 [Drouetiella sp.]
MERSEADFSLVITRNQDGSASLKVMTREQDGSKSALTCELNAVDAAGLAHQLQPDLARKAKAFDFLSERFAQHFERDFQDVEAVREWALEHGNY